MQGLAAKKTHRPHRLQNYCGRNGHAALDNCLGDAIDKS